MYVYLYMYVCIYIYISSDLLAQVSLPPSRHGEGSVRRHDGRRGPRPAADVLRHRDLRHRHARRQGRHGLHGHLHRRRGRHGRVLADGEGRRDAGRIHKGTLGHNRAVIFIFFQGERDSTAGNYPCGAGRSGIYLGSYSKGARVDFKLTN